MKSSHVRVRFAPAPTGFMHLGNVRAALMNYLFARQKAGVFVVRIEDTDATRNVDPGAKHILDDLLWLSLSYDEGPGCGGPYAPYFQSERTHLYAEYLQLLKDKNRVYPCFCTLEELEKKRKRQIALKLPPRYDRACLRLTPEERAELLSSHTPFVWRFQLPDSVVEVQDMARGTLVYDLKHFSDFALTRADETFTFIFANCVDDCLMKMTHIIRGEDHLSNTALQAALYETFDYPLPIFWHLPIICNSEGKKLSKRDFGFSLTDLRVGGFLPEAIDNYVAIIGGSFAQEVMSLQELSAHYNFDEIASTGPIGYDVEKLRWLNHKWMGRITLDQLMERCLPYLRHAYPAVDTLEREKLEQLVNAVRSELVTLHDCVEALRFYFKRPPVAKEMCQDVDAQVCGVIQQALGARGVSFNADKFLEAVRSLSKDAQVSPEKIYGTIRLALTGSVHGPRIKDLIALLPDTEVFERMHVLLDCCTATTQ